MFCATKCVASAVGLLLHLVVLWFVQGVVLCLVVCPKLRSLVQRLSTNAAIDKNACGAGRARLSLLTNDPSFGTRVDRRIAPLFHSKFYHCYLRHVPTCLQLICSNAWQTLFQMKISSAEKFLQEGIEKFGAQQIILLGAGFDTIAYRVAYKVRSGEWESAGAVKIYEIDAPCVQKQKLAKMGNGLSHSEWEEYVDGIEYVPVNFEESGALKKALRGAGIDNNTPTVVLWEGVTPYLTSSAFESTLRDLRETLANDGTARQLVWLDCLPEDVVKNYYKFWGKVIEETSAPSYSRWFVPWDSFCVILLLWFNSITNWFVIPNDFLLFAATQMVGAPLLFGLPVTLTGAHLMCRDTQMSLVRLVTSGDMLDKLASNQCCQHSMLLDWILNIMILEVKPK